MASGHAPGLPIEIRTAAPEDRPQSLLTAFLAHLSLSINSAWYVTYVESTTRIPISRNLALVFFSCRPGWLLILVSLPARFIQFIEV
jgi:hypothetical protein